MRRRSRASSKVANARSRKAKTLKAARHSSASVASQETEVARLRRELDEARQQQAATTDVLRIVSASSGEVKPVFEAILNKAVRICEAKFGMLTLYEGNSVCPG
jgi:hypothetical protein